MRAMILAAGRGERLKPLTDKIPKPLLKVKGKALIVHQIEKLANARIKDIVINHAWLGEQITEYLKDGKTYGVKIQYSKEPVGALETAGGIIKALPLLGNEPFMVVNADIWTDFDYSSLNLSMDSLANLVLVKNPQHNPDGDFALVNDKLVILDDKNTSYTFSGIGIYHPDIFKPYAQGRRALLSVLNEAIVKNKVSGVLHQGMWSDIGSLARLEYARES